MAGIRQIFGFALTALYFVLLYAVVIVLAPLALVVLSIAWLLDWFKSPNNEKTTPIVWILAVGAAGMVINLLCIPFGLLWYRLRGKPMPHPMD